MTTMDKATSYPLAWPAGWPRGPRGGKMHGRFNERGRDLTVSRALDRLEAELKRLGVPDWNVIVSTNLRLGMRGAPLSNQAEPDDRGVACYFKLKGKDRVLACDRFTKVADNIAAIAAHIDCIRGVDRYGVGTLDQAFAGYSALPPPSADNRPAWRTILEYSGDARPSRAEVDARFRALAMREHPDNGGSQDRMADLNDAIAQARKELA